MKRSGRHRGGWGGGGQMGAAHRSRQRGVKKAAGIKEQGFLAALEVAGKGGRRKMRSNHDLDSKTPRHNRQGLTPREPPHPPHSISVKTITENRTVEGDGAQFGDVSKPATSPISP